jgi:hypothetical protein
MGGIKAGSLSVWEQEGGAYCLLAVSRRLRSEIAIEGAKMRCQISRSDALVDYRNIDCGFFEVTRIAN